MARNASSGGVDVGQYALDTGHTRRHRLSIKPLPDPRHRLRDLAAERRSSLSSLAIMLGRPKNYLQLFVRIGLPDVLPPRDRRLLSQFFGVPEVELGGDDPKWSKWKRR